MARETEPLLARRPSSHDSREAAEEDALLSGRTQTRAPLFDFSEVQWKPLRETLAFLWAFLATIAIIILAVLLQHSYHDGQSTPPHTSPSPSVPRTDPANVRPPGKRNLIFMVSDGMGPSSLSLARSFSQYVSDAPFNHTLLLDSLLLGQSRTRSSSSLVTDSAAGATAFSCGEKSYNGAISVLPDGTPCPSVMEAAKRAGYMTGVVVTTRVTDATPACFGSHVLRREFEDDIAAQMVGVSPIGNLSTAPMDIILGGGRCHFVPGNASQSCRLDDRDIAREASDAGWAWIDSREEFDALSNSGKEILPLLALFAPGDIPFEIDRRFQNDTYPSLAESATTALRLLSQATADQDQGFFLMIEGSRIDHAGHINDPAAQAHEVLVYDATMRVVLDFIADQETPTLMLATSDHETGGLALARQLNRTYPHYGWYPAALANATYSAEQTAREFHAHLGSLDAAGHEKNEKKKKKHHPDSTERFVAELVKRNLGFEASVREVQLLVAEPVYAVWVLADMISRRAEIGWSTHGHTAADVNIYSSAAIRSERRRSHGGDGGGGGSSSSKERDGHEGWMKAVRERLGGNRENTDVGAFLRWWLDVEKEVLEVGKELVAGAEGVAVSMAREGLMEGERRSGIEGFRHDEKMEGLEAKYQLWKEEVGWGP